MFIVNLNEIRYTVFIRFGNMKILTLDQLNGFRCKVGRDPGSFPASKLKGPAVTNVN